MWDLKCFRSDVTVSLLRTIRDTHVDKAVLRVDQRCGTDIAIYLDGMVYVACVPKVPDRVRLPVSWPYKLSSGPIVTRILSAGGKCRDGKH